MIEDVGYGKGLFINLVMEALSGRERQQSLIGLYMK
jgi:hypothetical protein